ncbi:MAE_28990/MAE_18760 family HEPN-like nuclease [Zobellella denitrificans]|jgi:hypothetical protein
MSFDPVLSDLVDQRLSDIAIAKKCVTRARSTVERAYLEQSAILTIYASLEGGVRDLVKALLREIDGSKIKYSDLTPCYATLALNKVCKLDREVKDAGKQISTTIEIIQAIMSPPKLPNDVDLESNLTPKVLKRVFASLDLPEPINSQTDENDLNILLRFRNNIAHGDRRMPIGLERLDQLSRIAVKLITEAAASISEAKRTEVWLTKP